ncbi:hypothetical protein B0H11DRAFT_2221399 [Mycena galericulata]|nr:hypothetical protein B0H11DRAFT_2221399 [Mycena galericulata]
MYYDSFKLPSVYPNPVRPKLEAGSRRMGGPSAAIYACVLVVGRLRYPRDTVWFICAMEYAYQASPSCILRSESGTASPLLDAVHSSRPAHFFPILVSAGYMPASTSSQTPPHLGNTHEAVVGASTLSRPRRTDGRLWHCAA